MKRKEKEKFKNKERWGSLCGEKGGTKKCKMITVTSVYRVSMTFRDEAGVRGKILCSRVI